MATLAEQIKAEQDALAKIKSGNKPAPGTPSVASVTGVTPGANGVPTVRKGEDIMSSRGFSIIRLVKAIGSTPTSGDPWQNAKIEKDFNNTMRKAFGETLSSRVAMNSLVAPFGSELVPDTLADDQPLGVNPNALRAEMKGLMAAGVKGADSGEIWDRFQKSYSHEAAVLKDHLVKTGFTGTPQSWLDLTLGGSLVGPPAFGELIDLFRNRDALTNAGATIIPLPPTGRIIFPRQTNATTATWLGENTQGPTTVLKTGELILSGKKLMALLALPNELIRFASPAAEALARMDLMKTLVLGFDFAALSGAGSDVSPLGISNTPSIWCTNPGTGQNSFSISGAATNGDTLNPQDLYAFPAQIEASNAVMEGFIMRPEEYWGLLGLRADAAVAGDKAGLFMFSPFRNIGDKLDDRNINGFRVTTTPQVVNTDTKGSGSGLTQVFGGMWSDVLLAFFGGMEFAAATLGDVLGGGFSSDQTVVRAILIGDSGVRHPGAFALANQLIIPTL
jgi:HK97 family phage major capsid protein